VIAFLDQPRQAAIFQSVAAQKFRGVFVAHLGEFRFDLAADRARSGIGTRRYFNEIVFRDCRFEVFAQFGALANVEHVEHRLLAQEHEAANALLVVGRDLHFAQRLFGFEKSFGLDEQLVFFFQFGRLHLLQIFFQALQPLFDLAEVAHHQVELDVPDVAQRIDRTHVRDRIVLECPQHVDERIHLAQMTDVGGFFQRVLADRAHVHIFDRGVRQFLGVIERS